MSPDQIVATIIALMTSDTEPAFDALKDGGHEDRYPMAIEACPRPIGPLEVEGSTVIGGWIAVPENLDATDGETVPPGVGDPQFAFHRACTDPMIDLHGGPGGHTVHDIPMNAGLSDFLRHRRDIISFDQRDASIPDRTVACYIEFAEKCDLRRRPETRVLRPAGSATRPQGETHVTRADLRTHRRIDSRARSKRIRHAQGGR